MNTKEKLMQLLELCIEKQLNIEFNTRLFLVCVFNRRQSFNYESNYGGENEGFEYSRCVKLDDLIDKVKKY